jgi:hypothetical protein
LTLVDFSIIFVHGLWGHPQKTFETDAASNSQATADFPGPDTGRKNSLADLVRSVTSSKKSPTITEGTSTDYTLSTTSTNLTKSSAGTTRSFELWNTALSSDQVNRTRPKKCYWPHDLLPLDIPEARILTYGYDADVIGSSQADEGNIHNFTRHSQDLLARLEREIQDDVSNQTRYLISEIDSLN